MLVYESICVRQKEPVWFFFYQEEVSFVLAVGDVFHVEGNDVFCMAS